MSYLDTPVSELRSMIVFDEKGVTKCLPVSFDGADPVSASFYEACEAEENGQTVVVWSGSLGTWKPLSYFRELAEDPLRTMLASLLGR